MFVIVFSFITIFANSNLTTQMTKFKILILLFILNTSLWAQEYEFGLVAGGGNYVGDIGKEYYFYPNKIGGGIVFKRTVNQWFSLRLNFNYFQIDANDSEAESLGRQIRNYKSVGQIFHFSAGVEYNFIARNPFLQLQTINKLTPYFYSGLGLGNYSGNFYHDNKEKNGLEYNGTNLNIPMILGVKYKASQHFIIALEAGAYYYFTDNLDGTISYFGDEEKVISDKNIQTTNINSNDWYTFSSISFIYTFGDLSCYFNMF